MNDYPAVFDNGPYRNDGAFGGDSYGWQRAIFRLNSFVDISDTRFRFLYYSDAVERESVGWVIDNVRVTSFAPTLEPVKNVRIRPYGGGVRITWWNNGADSYRILRGPDPYKTMWHVGNSDGGSFVDNNAFNSGRNQFTYRVVAVLE
jgi:hypothetical protein